MEIAGLERATRNVTVACAVAGPSLRWALYGDKPEHSPTSFPPGAGLLRNTFIFAVL